MIWQNLIYGLIIGLGFIIPGVSGGVLATILGIYDKIIFKITNLTKNLKENLTYLIPIIIGIILSVLIFSKIILYLLNYKLEFISFVFIGFITGCIPYLINEIKIKTSKNIALIPFFIALLLGIILFIIENNLGKEITNPNFFIMILAGIFYAFGKIVPGISGAALLMILGIYKYFLNIIANPFNINIYILIKFIPFIISFLISAILIIKIMNILLTKYFQITYSAIIGFVISSILFIYPHTFNLISLIITILAFIISYNLSK